MRVPVLLHRKDLKYWVLKDVGEKDRCYWTTKVENNVASLSCGANLTDQQMETWTVALQRVRGGLIEQKRFDQEQIEIVILRFGENRTFTVEPITQ